MSHLEPLDRADLQQLEPVLAASEAMMGFVPNSMLTMAHMPQLTMAFSMLAGTVFGADLKQLVQNNAPHVPQDPEAAAALPPDQVQLIAYATSLAAGCRYCQAHTSHNGVRFGLSEEKITNLLNYADSDAYSATEKALIGIALAAGAVPNEASKEHFDALKQHFSDRQITQIVGVISLFGFLNRWNDTMATQLEATPLAAADGLLATGGWQAGKHGT
ncbi:MAG: carboxymuconolactone decarboxylase family protein [Pseudomonadota bacterium]